MFSGHAVGFMRSGLSFLRGRLLYGNDEVLKRFFNAVNDKKAPEAINAAAALEILDLQHTILNHVQSGVASF
jgi:hypothetical protein